jgi:hypothetical protein
MSPMTALLHTMYSLLKQGGYAALKDTVYSPVFYGAVAFILVLERLYPAKPDQKMLSVGFFHDMAWGVFELSLVGVVVSAYTELLQDLYKASIFSRIFVFIIWNTSFHGPSSCFR